MHCLRRWCKISSQRCGQSRITPGKSQTAGQKLPETDDDGQIPPPRGALMTESGVHPPSAGPLHRSVVQKAQMACEAALLNRRRTACRHESRRGGIGRRDRLRIYCPQGCGGSSPLVGTGIQRPGPWPSGKAPALQAGDRRFESDRVHLTSCRIHKKRSTLNNTSAGVVQW